MENILIINTSNNKRILVGISINGKVKELLHEPKDYKSEIVLELIERLLKENNLSIKQIKRIEVKIDSGSFTGLRVGASIANALSYLLNIKINELKIGETVIPVYNS